MRAIDIYSGDILLDKKLYKTYENILIYDISYTNFMDSIPLRIRLDKIDGFIKVHDRIRYLVIPGRSWFDKISDNIKYLIREKSSTSDSINQNFERIRTD